MSGLCFSKGGAKLSFTQFIGKSVLVVEDDAKIRNLVKIYLTREGYEVFEAMNGLEAKEKIQQLDPCILILDLMLPKISGEAICQWVRRFAKHDAYYYVDSKSFREKSIEGLKLGADDYVTKPFSPAELMARVEAVLRRTANRCQKLSFRGLTIKPIKGEVTLNGKRLHLTHFLNLNFFSYIYCSIPNKSYPGSKFYKLIYENGERVASTNDRCPY